MRAIPSLSVLVTGGAGFIGSHLVRLLLQRGHRVLNVDKLTYAGNLRSLEDVEGHPQYSFLQADIADAAAMREAFARFRPDRVLHLAAESHVDRSIDSPMEFLHTNVLGTAVLLQAAREQLSRAPGRFLFVHVSTDEVYGSLGKEGVFTETSPYDPSSPYSASKAAGDHLVRSWARTYGLPVIVTNCTNNYGPCQFPEKLIPLVILKALQGEPIPVYGQGAQLRDWIHVEDHCTALALVAEQGQEGNTYHIGAGNEWRNLDLVKQLLEIVGSRSEIAFVKDRPGHDFRYALDSARIRSELVWEPKWNMADGLRQTVDWYRMHASWWQAD